MDENEPKKVLDNTEERASTNVYPTATIENITVDALAGTYSFGNRCAFGSQQREREGGINYILTNAVQFLSNFGTCKCHLECGKWRIIQSKPHLMHVEVAQMVGRL